MLRLTSLVLAATASGVLGFLAFPEPALWPLAFVALLPLRLDLHLRPKWAPYAWLGGAWAGFVMHLGGFFWVVHLLRVFGHLPLPVALAGWLVLCAVQGAGVGLWAALVAAAQGRIGTRWAPLVDGLLWVLIEFAWPQLFPWALGHALHGQVPLLQVVELGGVAPLSFGLVATAGALALVALPRGLRRALPALVAVAFYWAGVWGYGELRIRQLDAALAQAPTVRVAIVEADVGVAAKGRRGRVAANLARHQRLSRWAQQAGAELVVWPETAYDPQWIRLGREPRGHRLASLWPDPAWDALPPRGDHLLLDPPPAAPEPQLDARAGVEQSARLSPQRGFDVPLLTGAITWEPEPDPPGPGPLWARRHYNSVLLFDREGRVGDRVQHKNHLLLFGESLPLGRRLPWLYSLLPATGHYTAGEEARVLRLGQLRVAPLICYEAILPRYARRFAAQRPNLLVTVANDDWFGPRGEPWLHLALSVFRAVEHRAELVRATNTGISAFVDPLGRVRSSSRLGGAEVLLRDVPLWGERGPFVRCGEVFVLLCGLTLLLVLRRGRRDRCRGRRFGSRVGAASARLPVAPRAQETAHPLGRMR